MKPLCGKHLQRRGGGYLSKDSKPGSAPKEEGPIIVLFHVPVTLPRQKRNLRTSAPDRIYHRTECALLRERIYHTRKVLSLNDAQLYQLHVHLGNNLSVQTGNWSTASPTGSQYPEHKRTRDTRLKSMTVAPPRVIQRHNLMPRELWYTSRIGSSQRKKFRFWPKVAITPKNLPVENPIVNVESSIRGLTVDAAEEIRRETSRILQHAKAPKNSFTNKERSAIKTNADKHIIVLSADKGNATTVLNYGDYTQKIRNLPDPDNYKKLLRDPTGQVLRKTNQLIRNSQIPVHEQTGLIKSEALPPRLYGLPKIHKPALRPIVSAIGSATYPIAKHLTNRLQPYVGNTTSHIKDSAHFIDKIKTHMLKQTDLLVSFNVASLFTMVPSKSVLEQLHNIFPREITKLFEHVLTTTYFQWNNDYYEQLDGVALGSPLTPVIANFYMEFLESRALDTAAQKPLCWYRYVDDTFVVWLHGTDALGEFLQHLNSVHPGIQFTMELKKDGQLPFLDVLVNRNRDGTLGHRVYRKPTDTDRYLHYNSNHHPKQTRAVIKTLIDLVARICEPKHIEQELQHLNQALQAMEIRK
ncbi:hypothetical protein Trydic_g22237 [Trypoxylus dichotomus]